MARLKEMGAWLGRNGESVYGTLGGPITPRPWGVTTQKANLTYIHVLDWPDEVLALPRLPKPVRKAALLGGRPVTLRVADGGLLLHLPPANRDVFDTVVVLES